MNKRIPLVVSAVTLVCAAILSAWAWVEVDGSTVPAGVGSDLEPVSKFQGLVAGPLLFIGLPIALFLLIARIEPRRAHLWSSAKAYGAIGIAGVVGGLGAHAAFVLRATDRNLALSENLIELVLPILLSSDANTHERSRRRRGSRHGRRFHPDLRAGWAVGLVAGGILALLALAAAALRRVWRRRSGR
jgi:hypothetical protein